ncbi:MAG: signal peptidase II [Pelagibacteraceae bacterium BACL5 MAG-120820-bin39]|jgi:signal peptidase II|nr:MAG: signal peptidase II [Pelagibacteraceae bacterium BACL5 MAG-120820-bin39]
MIFTYLTKKFYINIFTVFFIFFLDRISKLYVIYLHDKRFGGDLFSSDYLNINLIWNEGIAFGLFAFEESEFYNFLTLFISLIISVIIYMVIKSNGLKRFALLMIIGGALGNLYDRVVFLAVPDFIDFHIGNFHWFTFNIADIFISVGVIFMILLEFIDNNKDKINE